MESKSKKVNSRLLGRHNNPIDKQIKVIAKSMGITTTALVRMATIDYLRTRGYAI